MDNLPHQNENGIIGKMIIQINVPPVDNDATAENHKRESSERKVKRINLCKPHKFDEQLIIDIQPAQNQFNEQTINNDASIDSKMNYHLEPEKTVLPDSNGQQSYQDFLNKETAKDKEVSKTGTSSDDNPPTQKPITKDKIKHYINVKSDTFCNDVSEYIMKKQEFIFFNGSIYCYSEPIYKRLNDHCAVTTIRRLLPGDLGSRIKMTQLNEILNLIKTTPNIQKSEAEIETSDRYICFRNGVYDLYKRKMFGHSPYNYFFSYVDVDYRPDKVEYGSYFEYYLERCTGGDEELKELIMQIIGYVISNSMDAKIFFILIGVADSGKSKFGDLFQGLIGKENCSHVPLQQIPVRFQSAQLCGKKLNLCMELPDAPIKDLGIIKQLTGGDMVQTEEKYQPSFSFKNVAKLLFGCNKLPSIRTTENAKAFFNRLILIPFNYAIPYSEQDKKLVDKLLDERNYIVDRAINAFHKLSENNFRFTYCKASDDLKKEYINSSNSVLEFVSDICILGNNYRIYGLDLYEKYSEYCTSRGYSRNDIFNYPGFCNMLKLHFKVDQHRWRSENENRNGLIGIALKT